MRVNRRINVYLTTATEAWAAPGECGTTFFELITHLQGGIKIQSQLSDQCFPKTLLSYQIERMCEKIGIPFLPNCIVGRWGYKKALKIIGSLT